MQTGVSKTSQVFSYIGLAIGVLLLLASIQMFINIRQLLKEGTVRKNGYDYVSVTKTVTNQNMAHPEQNLFNEQDIAALKAQPFIDDASPLVANDFRVQLSAGQMIPFSTDLFLETLDNGFLDTVPPSFRWQEGQVQLPIVLSSDFLDLYNIFAPGQGLPQVSKETASSIPVQVICSGNGLEETFVGKVVGFSDRVNSVLVPKEFMTWANDRYSRHKPLAVGRVFIKTTDINNPMLLKYFDAKGYTLNRDRTMFGRSKMIIQGIFSGLGVFGLLVVVLSLLLFSFYLQLVIARSRESLLLLITLGYDPTWLSRRVAGRFIPTYCIIILFAVGLTQLMQWGFHHFAMYDRPELSSWLHWGVLTTALVL